VADLNGDDRPDLVVADKFADAVSVVLGNGDGTFRARQLLTTGSNPTSVAVLDVNGDGKPDLVVTNSTGNTVGVFLGDGSGAFQPQQAFPAGNNPFAVALLDDRGKPVDINGDGKPDLVVANRYDGTVEVLLGNGDGTFHYPLGDPNKGTYPVGFMPRSVAVADVNGDGKPDLIIANGGNSYMPGSTVSVLLGNGDGTFGNTFDPVSHRFIMEADVPPLEVGTRPYSVAVADVNGDGKPDLVVANYANNTLSMLLGNGDGTFGGVFDPASRRFEGPAKTIQVVAYPNDVAYPNSVVLADVNGDGKPDLVVTDGYNDHRVSVLLNTTAPGAATPSFAGPQTFDVGPHPTSVSVTDVNGDGKPDLVVTNRGDGYGGTVSVLLGDGRGGFRYLNDEPEQGTFPVGSRPYSVAVADVNGDGKPDLVVANDGDNTVSVLLGNGDGAFIPANPLNGTGSRNTPFQANLTGALADSVTLNRSGNVLFRKGLGNSQFDSAKSLNNKRHLDRFGHVLLQGLAGDDTQGEDRPARDLTVLRTATGWGIATADLHPDPGLSSADNFVYTVSLYTLAADGSGTRATAFSTTRLPTRIVSGDLNGDGLDDLVVANSLDDSIQVAFQRPDGTFTSPLTLTTGGAPSDIFLTRVNGGPFLDIVVTNQASGDVSVFLNDENHSFTRSLRFRAGVGLYALDQNGATPAVSGQEQTVSLAAGDFLGNGRNNLVAVNRGADSFTVLANDGHGGFSDPQPPLTTTITGQPGPVLAGYFHGPDKPLDLAILMEDRPEVWIFTGDGQGHFQHTSSVAAGSQPTGLNQVRNAQTGFWDLLVGDPFGDVLVLQGKGDGTFKPPPPFTGDRASLDTQMHDAARPILVGNQRGDAVTVQTPTPDGKAYAPIQTLDVGTTTHLAPGAVQWAQLEGTQGLFDAVVIGSGSNSVLVYHTMSIDDAGVPTFAPPVSYPVGTNPVGLTIQDINGDGIPDMLVANQGSNDVSILFGSYDADGKWVGIAGPRLKSGGTGPLAVNVMPNLNDPAQPAIMVVTNGQDGSFALLPGRGLGFFDDRTPQLLTVPGHPVIRASIFTDMTGDALVTTDDGRLISFNLFNFDASVHVVFAPQPGDGATAVQPMPSDSNSLVAAMRDGSVELLQRDTATGMFHPMLSFTLLTPLTGIIPQQLQPSDLGLLELPSGGFEALVTSLGMGQVFAFKPEPFPNEFLTDEVGEPSEPILLTGGGGGGPTAGGNQSPFPQSLAELGSFVTQATPFGEALLGLVLTVAAITPVTLADLGNAAGGPVVEQLGGDSDFAPDGSEPGAAQLDLQVGGFGQRIDETLRKPDADPWPEPPDQDGPMSRAKPKGAGPILETDIFTVLAQKTVDQRWDFPGERGPQLLKLPTGDHWTARISEWELWLPDAIASRATGNAATWEAGAGPTTVRADSSDSQPLVDPGALETKARGPEPFEPWGTVSPAAVVKVVARAVHRLQTATIVLLVSASVEWSKSRSPTGPTDRSATNRSGDGPSCRGARRPRSPAGRPGSPSS
jgi:hypothetical protein